MMRLIRPEYLMPIHGEYRMLKEHQNLAIQCDIPEDHTFICQNGDVVIMDDEGCHKGKRVQAGDVYVDGSRIGDIVQ